MAHLLEPASSGRAKCRGCDEKIAEGTLRFGERLPNTFGEGEMTLWFHPVCAAYKRPEALLETLREDADAPVKDRDTIVTAAELGVLHRRLPRMHGVDRAPTGRARCRHCRELIDKDAWRIGLVFFVEGRFEPGGFIHASCARSYFGTTDLLDRTRHFNPGLSDEDLEALESELDAGGYSSSAHSSSDDSSSDDSSSIDSPASTE